MNTVIHIGIDVHKETNSLCSFHFSTQKSFWQTRIASKSSLVIKYVRKLQKEHPESTVLCGYEAGPTGYGLYRDLAKADIPCVIMAPTTLPKPPGNYVKTDRIDAEELDKHLAWGPTVPCIYRPRKMKRSEIIHGSEIPGKRLLDG